MCQSKRTCESVSSIKLTLSICWNGVIRDSRLLTGHTGDAKSVITF